VARARAIPAPRRSLLLQRFRYKKSARELTRHPAATGRRPGLQQVIYRLSPQNEASGLTSSRPTSQASWSRQTTSASALRPVTGCTSRTRRCSGRGAPTTAMQPEWLTSTVTALARCSAESSSHSTTNFTLEKMRLWLRNLAHRSCKAGEVAFLEVPVSMLTSRQKESTDRGRSEMQRYCDQGTGSIVLFRRFWRITVDARRDR